MHPTFIRALLHTLEVAPQENMTDEDKELYVVLNRFVHRLAEALSDEEVTDMWQRATKEQAGHNVV